MNKIEHSESIKELAAALSKAQGMIEAAKKDSTNPHFKSKYADLASVWDACREPLAKNGLSIAQLPFMTEGKSELCTMLMHSSGEWLRSYLPLNPIKNDPQGLGSALTYMRRYGLSAMTGVAPEEDDGNSASGRDDQPNKAAATQAALQQSHETVANISAREKQFEYCNDISDICDPDDLEGYRVDNQELWNGLPSEYSGVVQMHYESRKAALDRGEFTPGLVKFLNVAKQDAWVEQSETELKRLMTPEEIETWRMKNRNWVNALEKKRREVFVQAFEGHKTRVANATEQLNQLKAG